MVNAFILLKVEKEETDNVLNKLWEFDVIREAYKVRGEYEIIARIKTQTVRELHEFVSNKMKNIKGVKNTSTVRIIGKDHGKPREAPVVQIVDIKEIS